MSMSLLRVVSLLLVLVVLCNADDGYNGTCTKGALLKHSYSNTDSSWIFTWSIDCDAMVLRADIVATARGWVGFGINTEPKMRGANVIQARVMEGNQVEYVNAIAIGEEQPIPKLPSAYFNVTGSSNVTTTTISFSRLLSTEDANNRTLSSTTYVLWAYQSDNQSFAEYHSDRGAVKLNLFTGNEKKTVNYVLIHALLMVFAWGFLAPVGTYAARYLKNIGHTWYRLHSSMQYTVIVAVLVSFVLVENYIGPGFSNHFRSKHAIIGVVVVGLAVLQVLLGILSNALFKVTRARVPFFPDMLHWWLGRSVLILSLVNIFLGFDLYGLKQSNISPYIIYGVWIGISLLVIVFMEFKQGQVSHVASEYTPLNEAKHVSTRTPLITYFIYCIIAVVLFAACFYEIYKS